MTEQAGLTFSYVAAAAKLAAAFWLTHIAILLLRRGKSVPIWQIVLSILTVAASTIAWRSGGRPTAFASVNEMTQAPGGWVWLVACLLALLMLIDGLRQWMSDSLAKPGRRLPVISVALSLAGCGLCSYAIVTSTDAASIQGQPQLVMIASLISLFIVFALLLASTLELTVGSLGAELLALPWRRMSTIATFAFLVEILLAGWVIARLKPSDSIEMTAAPVLYEFSRLLLGYIAWCVPRRMLILSQKKELRGQASLALSGWIGLICFAVAMALPTAWPW